MGEKKRKNIVRKEKNSLMADKKKLSFGLVHLINRKEKTNYRPTYVYFIFGKKSRFTIVRV